MKLTSPTRTRFLTILLWLAAGVCWHGTAQAAGPSSQTAASIVNSDAGCTHLVQNLYQRLMAREAATDESSVLADRLKADGKAWIVIYATLTGSQEYAQRAGNSNNTFVAHLFQDLIGRAPSAEELSSSLSLLNQGNTHHQLAALIIDTDECRGQVVQTEYELLLRRDATDEEKTAGINVLNTGGLTQLVTSIVSSRSYFKSRGGGTSTGWQNALRADLLGTSEMGFTRRRGGIFDGGADGGGIVTPGTPGGSTSGGGIVTPGTPGGSTSGGGTPGGTPDGGTPGGDPADAGGNAGGTGSTPGTGGVFDAGGGVPDAGTAGGTTGDDTTGDVTNGPTTGNTSRGSVPMGMPGGMPGRMPGGVPSGVPAGNARLPLVQAILGSPEYFTNLVQDYYQRFLRRAATPAELNNWLAVLQGGGTSEQVLSGILTSDEYFNRAGGTTNTFLSKLSQDLLGETGSASGNPSGKSKKSKKSTAGDLLDILKDRLSKNQ